MSTEEVIYLNLNCYGYILLNLISQIFVIVVTIFVSNNICPHTNGGMQVFGELSLGMQVYMLYIVLFASDLGVAYNMVIS